MTRFVQPPAAAKAAGLILIEMTTMATDHIAVPKSRPCEPIYYRRDAVTPLGDSEH